MAADIELKIKKHIDKNTLYETKKCNTVISFFLSTKEIKSKHIFKQFPKN